MLLCCEHKQIYSVEVFKRIHRMHPATLTAENITSFIIMVLVGPVLGHGPFDLETSEEVENALLSVEAIGNTQRVLCPRLLGTLDRDLHCCCSRTGIHKFSSGRNLFHAIASFQSLVERLTVSDEVAMALQTRDDVGSSSKLVPYFSGTFQAATVES